jgi:hypothetical protein
LAAFCASAVGQNSSLLSSTVDAFVAEEFETMALHANALKQPIILFPREQRASS